MRVWRGDSKSSKLSHLAQAHTDSGNEIVRDSSAKLARFHTGTSVQVWRAILETSVRVAAQMSMEIAPRSHQKLYRNYF